MSCHYSADAAAPDGADPVLYFFEREPCRQQYAVCFGDGGAVPNAGTASPVCSGLCRATKACLLPKGTAVTVLFLQDDNAHAWAEVYLAGRAGRRWK